MAEIASEKRYCLKAFITDALTLSRLVAAAAILWLGWTVGRAAFPKAILLATAGWITDAVDGYIARRSHCQTRLGILDYPIDASLAWASFIFIALAGFISIRAMLLYTLFATLVTLWFRRKAVLVLFMRGVDLTVFYFALRDAFLYTLPLLIWLIFLAWLHRQRLRTETPQWLRELRALFWK
ncbi:MAG TPA: CDP-alcohol phosphatidyltransferase family protein [Anaerolineae bacterium]|nr:CDP-alcohol phosphatidyltransferase family protein [Caldilineae bacterium]HID33485.1 CDP-alcohol phosphatidyltransferase family protein [Anaerolineae bacterium]